MSIPSKLVPPFELPIPAHRFIVSLNPADAYLPPTPAAIAQSAIITAIAAGQFSEVSGLSAQLTTLEYGEGGHNDYFHQLPIRHKYPKITLSRGVVRDPGLFFWYQAGMSESIGSRRDGAIILLTPMGIPAIGWIFHGGLATGWTGPALKAGQSAIAIEQIEITHEGLLQVPLSPPVTP